MIVIIPTSKTMRAAANNKQSFRHPQFIQKAVQLDAELKKLSVFQIQTLMKVSPKLADKTSRLISRWTAKPKLQRAAIDSFLGDIYSGLQVHTWTPDDYTYADAHILMLSGLYGLLRPLDGIYPYRYEMGYKYPSSEFTNLYSFWGDMIAKRFPENKQILNLSSAEYSRVLHRYIDTSRFITPVFLTYSLKAKKPVFVTVHTKIARGAFASWIVRERITEIDSLKNFAELNYIYNPEMSTPLAPVFVCKTFGGLGLSVRLTVN